MVFNFIWRSGGTPEGFKQGRDMIGEALGQGVVINLNLVCPQI